MKWFASDYYTVAEQNGKIMFYNLKCDMTGAAGDNNEAPTTFFFEITEAEDGSLNQRCIIRMRGIAPGAGGSAYLPTGFFKLRKFH